uniref:Uncharacterized protein n=1 Tax=Megaselia scalaris TaxID=36166 RepID=T1GBW0_MEGSC
MEAGLPICRVCYQPATFFQVSGGIQIPTCTKCSGSVYPGQNLFLESTAEGVLPGQFIIQPTELIPTYQIVQDNTNHNVVSNRNNSTKNSVDMDKNLPLD